MRLFLFFTTSCLSICSFAQTFDCVGAYDYHGQPKATQIEIDPAFLKLPPLYSGDSGTTLKRGDSSNKYQLKYARDDGHFVLMVQQKLLDEGCGYISDYFDGRWGTDLYCTKVSSAPNAPSKP
jgi:hypothetical protein